LKPRRAVIESAAVRRNHDAPGSRLPIDAFDR
jgi:hypothetical protein